MAWIILVIAGLFEVGWASCLKATKGFTELWPTVGFLGFMVLSVYLLGIAVKTLPLGTAYTVWTGIGAVGTVVVGIAVMGESADLRRLVCLSLILAGVVGLKLTSSH